MNFAGLETIDMKVFRDARGVFVKPFHLGLFRELGLTTEFKEDFYSVSAKGVLRGLHFQIPPEDHSKLIYCSRGRVLDVAVDLRIGSPSFGKTFSIELSEANGKALYLPPGMAHGFVSLTDDATVHYKVSTMHSVAHDKGILWSSIDFDWSAAVGSNKAPIVSERDAAFEKLSDYKSPFKFEGLKK